MQTVAGWGCTRIFTNAIFRITRIGPISDHLLEPGCGAAKLSEESADAALAKLCQLYWYPIYEFVRRRGYHGH
jgi:hypothetical protein